VEVFMGVFWILFWGSVIYLFVVTIVRPERHREAREPSDAVEIAKRRYARGEISAEQLQEIRHLEEG